MRVLFQMGANDSAGLICQAWHDCLHNNPRWLPEGGAPEDVILKDKSFLIDILLWGITVVGDSPQFSALTAQNAPRQAVGSVLTLTNSLGFAISIASIELFVRLAERMALANHRLQSGIETVSFITNEEHTFISSSTVREIASLGGDVSSMVPAHVDAALKLKVAGMQESQLPPNALRD